MTEHAVVTSVILWRPPAAAGPPSRASPRLAAQTRCRSHWCATAPRTVQKGKATNSKIIDSVTVLQMHEVMHHALLYKLFPMDQL